MKRRPRGGASLRVVAAVMIVAGCGGSAPALAADLAVSPAGSDSASCAPSAPCRSFARAYTVAAPGQVIAVAPGTYPEQAIPADASKAGARAAVLFVPQGGAVSIADLTVNGYNVEVRDVRTDGFAARAGAHGVVLRNVEIHGSFVIRSASDVSLIGGSVGPAPDGASFISAEYQSTTPSSNITIDGVLFHDFVKVTDGAHVDCLAVDDVDGLVIRHSRFINCEHFDLIFGNDNNSGRAARNVLVENNFFDCCRSGYYAIGYGGLDGPVNVRFNSFTLGMGWLNGTDLVPDGLVTLDSNVIADNNSANCSRGIWRFNVVTRGSACGGRLAATGFALAPADLHLLPGSAAIGFGNPTSYPGTDIDGHPRPVGAPDAGADEFGSSPGAAPGDPGTPAGPGKTASPTALRPPQRWKRERGAPNATLLFAPVNLRAFRRSGLPLTITCDDPCSAAARLRVGRRTAKRYHLRRTLGSDRSHRRSKRGRVKLVIEPSRRTARRLRHAKTVKMTLHLRAWDRRGHATRAAVRITVVR